MRRSLRTPPTRRSTRRTRPQHIAGALLLGFATAILAPTAAPAQTIEYLLRPTSQIRPVCAACPDDDGAGQELHGTFDVTMMPIPEAHTIEAITGIHWHSDDFRIVGAGFLERLGRNRISMVVDARVNDQPVLLTSTAHPIESGGSLQLSLSSAPDSPVAVEIDLVAFPNTTDGPDADGDGLPDVLDLCPQIADARQGDEDRDGVGDACDACPGTPFGDAVLDDGCSVEQACPCAGPRPGVLWKSQKEYVTCVARGLKILAQEEEITREQARRTVQEAVRSGCGTPVIARAAAADATR